MPIGHQWGFIFGGMDSRTLAHELGHGLFTLRHTFDKDYGLEAQSTDNLMDYAGGSELIKYQWDILHDPARLGAPFQRDREGAEVVTDTSMISSWSEIFPESTDEQLEKIARIYDTVAFNFDHYFDESKVTNKNINEEDLNNWSIRRSSHLQPKGRIELLVDHIALNDNPGYASVDSNEIYVKKYEYNVTFDSVVTVCKTKVSLFNYVDNISFTKPQILNFDTLSELTTMKVASFKFKENTTSVGVLNPISPMGNSLNGSVSNKKLSFRVDDYLVVAFYSAAGRNPDFVFQLLPESFSTKNFELAAWLKHLNILIDERNDTLNDGTIIGDPLPDPEVTVTTNIYKGFHGCTRWVKNSTCPTEYTNYGMSYTGKNKRHDGVDFTADVGTPIHAIKGGKVKSLCNTYIRRNNDFKDIDGIDAHGNISQNANCGCHYGGGYGNYVIIETRSEDYVRKINGDSTKLFYIRYAHMDTLYIQKDQVILEGSIIGLSGCSGNAASYPYDQNHLYHVHIEADDESTCAGIRMINVLDLIETNIEIPPNN